MSKSTLSYQKTGYFSKLMCDYLNKETTLDNFYGNFPEIENFETQVEAKKASFDSSLRKRLVTQLKKQYAQLEPSEVTKHNIDSLISENTFTITTGHQLNLFTGPLYFLYKIISVINLSKDLKKKYPKNHFVPVYWMATEDHDFDEINYFNFKGKKIVWERESGGAVGEFTTDGLDSVLEILKGEFGTTDHAKFLLDLFEEAYVKHDNLADATRYLGNALFKNDGLVIVDGNDKELKKAFIPFAEKELTKRTSYNCISDTTKRLTGLGYPEQVHPREINLFYLTEGLRERIIERDGKFYVNDTNLSFSEFEILEELKSNPQRFSPNALLRPLFQEVILPNLCYVGGGGELAYWFQLQDYFKEVEVVFPILLLRNSVLLSSNKFSEKLKKLQVDIDQLFLDQDELKSAYTRQLSTIDIDFSKQKNYLKQQFKELYELASKTDKSFMGAVAAQEKKQLNGLDHLENRLLKAQKRNLCDALNRLTVIQNDLFPKQSLQERTVNFSEMYLEYGDLLIDLLKKDLKPLEHKFTILNLP